MMAPDKRSRQDNVLEHIITAYIELGVPVGSAVLCERSNLCLSPATIRNIMRELEESGFIFQPHTSAGRIPTDAGYRYYLDNIMRPEEITDAQKDSVSFLCDSAEGEFDALLDGALRLLSDISNEASLVLFPKPTRNSTKEKKLASFGWHHLLGQPEFKDASRSNRLIKALEEKDELLGFVEENISGIHACVFIGSESKCCQIQDCSIVMSGYGPGSGVIGAIGVIGPTRMPYKRVVPVVDFVACQIGCVLENMEL